MIGDLFNTPIYNFLVVAGLALILLAIAGRIGDWIELKQNVQRIVAGSVGGILLVFGLASNPALTPDNAASSNSATPVAASPAPAQPSSSQISMLLGNDWQPISPVEFEDYWEDMRPGTNQRRDAFLITEERLNSLDVSTERLDRVIAQIVREWSNDAPDTWNGEPVKCFVKIQRQDSSFNYVPCQISGSSGQCQLPWQLDSAGRRCGGRAASERPGG